MLKRASLVSLAREDVGHVTRLLTSSLGVPLARFLGKGVARYRVKLGVEAGVSPLRVLPGVITCGSFPHSSDCRLSNAVCFNAGGSDERVIVCSGDGRVVDRCRKRSFEVIRGMRGALTGGGCCILEVRVGLPGRGSFGRLRFGRVGCFKSVLLG